MRRSTVVKKDTASCDIVHGSSRPKIYVKRVMRRTAIVKKDKALSLTLAAPKDEASNTYTNQGAQVWVVESILRTICQCRMAALEASRQWNVSKKWGQYWYHIIRKCCCERNRDISTGTTLSAYAAVCEKRGLYLYHIIRKCRHAYVDVISLHSNRIQQLSIWRDKRLGMRVRNSFERSEQQRFRIFSAIQISDVFKIL